MQRVLFSESSRHVGGQELQLLAQAVGLQARGIESRILCRADCQLTERATEKGIRVLNIPFRNSFHLPSIAAVHRELRSFRPDALLCHSGHDANTGALAARLMTRRPVLLRARTYQHGVPRAFSYNTLFDRTLLPSEALRSQLLLNSGIDPTRLHVLHPGIDFDGIVAAARLPLTKEVAESIGELPQRRIVHAAMLRPEKGHLLMLDVIAALQGKYPDIAYVIAGEGEMREPILNRAKSLGISHRVALLGLVTPIPALLQHATLVVMPSSYEPLGMSQIEALALGIPVVASRVGGIPETISDGTTGLLAAPDDSGAWVDAIDRALATPEQMQAMAKRGSTDVRRRFSMSSNLDGLLEHITAGRLPQ